MRKYIYILFSLMLLCSLFPSVSYEDDEALGSYPFDQRYTYQYPKDFFKKGGPLVSFNPDFNLKIGILVNNQSNLPLKDIIDTIFDYSPFDRYRNFFVFILYNEIDRHIHLRKTYLTAYDSYGESVPGGLDLGSSAMRAGLVVLNVDDYEFERTGTKGYARGNLAVAQKATILHELGHALADLSEEYSKNEREMEKETKKLLKDIGIKYIYGEHEIWYSEKANLEYRNSPVIKWQPLIDHGFIPDKRINRVQLVNGVDVGRFIVPTESCVMNNRITGKIEFCPVCQLQIIDAICSMSGAIPVWRKVSSNE